MNESHTHKIVTEAFRLAESDAYVADLLLNWIDARTVPDQNNAFAALEVALTELNNLMESCNL